MGNTAWRPRSMIDCPPILTTFTSGIIATASYASSTRESVRVASARALRIRRRSCMGRDTAGRGRCGRDRGVLDDRPDVLSGERARQLSRPEPVDDLHALDVTCRAPGREELAVEDELLRHVREQLLERRF